MSLDCDIKELVSTLDIDHTVEIVVLMDQKRGIKKTKSVYQKFFDGL